MMLAPMAPHLKHLVHTPPIVLRSTLVIDIFDLPHPINPAKTCPLHVLLYFYCTFTRRYPALQQGLAFVYIRY